MESITGRSIFSREGIRLILNNGYIEAIEKAAIPADAPYLSFGFYDIQVNGFAGYDYNTAGLKVEHVREIVKLLVASGTTQHLPTIITNSNERIISNLRIIAEAIEESAELAAAIPGIHLESPYIFGEEGPRGAHSRKFICDPNPGEFAECQEASGGRIKLITLAPEKMGAIEFISEVSRQEVVVALGHTAAEPGLIKGAVDAGAKISTHLGNGSHEKLTRLNNYIWEQLAEKRLWASLITDGFHLPPPVVQVFLRAKGLEQIILVSDAAVLGGYKPGIHKWGDIDVEVFRNGHLGLYGTKYLAGASHLLDRDIAQFINFTGLSLAEAIQLCTANPAKLLDSDFSGNEFCTGAPANLTKFYWHHGDEALTVQQTLLRGDILYSKKSTKQC